VATKEFDVAKRRNPKKLLDGMFEITKSQAGRSPRPSPSTPDPQSLQRRKKLMRRIARRLAKPLGKAFERSGLDPCNEKHQAQLLVLLAFAVYGGRDRGQPKQWSRKKLRRLRTDVAQIGADNPGLSEEECCKRLLKGGRYTVKSETLRRKLQDAKKLEQQDRLVAASGKESVLTEVSKTLKERT
jgi:hypothetical protein